MKTCQIKEEGEERRGSRVHQSDLDQEILAGDAAGEQVGSERHPSGNCRENIFMNDPTISSGMITNI